MMGGDGKIEEGELNEMHLSAISEAMNQMIGSAATSLSSMLNKRINISPPTAFIIRFEIQKHMKILLMRLLLRLLSKW